MNVTIALTFSVKSASSLSPFMASVTTKLKMSETCQVIQTTQPHSFSMLEPLSVTTQCTFEDTFHLSAIFFSIGNKLSAV